MQGTGCKVQVVGYKLQGTRHKVQIAAGYDTIAVFARPNGVQSGEKFCISFAVIFFTANLLAGRQGALRKNAKNTKSAVRQR